MTKKHYSIAILIAAICSMSNISALTANATGMYILSPARRLESMMYCNSDGSYSGASPYKLTEGENGAAILTSGKEKALNILVITDGTPLEEYELSSSEVREQNAVFSGVHEIDYTYDAVMNFFDDETRQKIESYGENVRFYQFSHDTMPNGLPDAVNREIRSKMLENHHILDAIVYTEQLSFHARFSGNIVAHPSELCKTDKTRYTELLNQTIDDVKQIQAECKALRTDWDADVAEYVSTHDTQQLTESELNIALQEAGIQSDYELMKKGYEYAEKLEQVSEGAFAGAQAGFIETWDVKVTLSGNSCWDGIGNVNDDDVINSADASCILTASAKLGTGQSDSFTDAQKNSADVNADGKINAADAVLILQYTAVSGSGENISIASFAK